MKHIDWKDVLTRAAKTFAQAAISFLILALGGVDFAEGDLSGTFWTGLCLSAVAAGVSAAWNGVIQPLFAREKDGQDKAENG